MKDVRVVVDNRIRVELGPGGLSPDQAEDLRGLFEHTNPKRRSMEAMRIPGYWKEPAIERTWSDKRSQSGSWLTVPRGGMKRVLSVFQKHDLCPLVEDRRTSGVADLRGGIPVHKVELRDYQRALVNSAVSAETCMLRAPTGSGKTEVAFAYASEVNVPTLVLVNTRVLLDQWVERASRTLGLSERQVGVVQGNRRELRPLTVAMQQSLHHQGFDDEFAATWGAVVYDEVQLASASSFYAIVDRFPARYRLGVSADNRRKDGKEYLNHDLFGEVAYEVKRDALIEQGHVMDIDVIVQPTEFRADWYGIDEDPETGEERELDFNRLSDEITDDEARTLLGVEHAAREARDGALVFVMARRRDHCQRIAAALVARGVPSGYLIGGPDYRKEFKATAQAMREGRVRVGVGTIQSIGTGIDFPAINAAVVMTPLAGNRQLFNQVRGRVCRNSDGKVLSRLYYLWDSRCSYGLSHLKNLVAQNRMVTIVTPGGGVVGRDYLTSLKKRRVASAW